MPNHSEPTTPRPSERTDQRKVASLGTDHSRSAVAIACEMKAINQPSCRRAECSANLEEEGCWTRDTHHGKDGSEQEEIVG